MLVKTKFKIKIELFQYNKHTNDYCIRYTYKPRMTNPLNWIGEYKRKRIWNGLSHRDNINMRSGKFNKSKLGIWRTKQLIINEVFKDIDKWEKG